MKKINWLALTGIVSIAFSLQAEAQVVQTLPEVTVAARNYKYLKAVNYTEAAQPVKLLERKAAAYDVKNSEYYNDEYDSYYISFYLPSGYLLAVYDQDGKMLRTAERYKNSALPYVVRSAVAQRYPGWAITKDVYRVQYEEDSHTKFDYKLLLEKGDQRMRVRINDKGEFL